MNIGKVIRTGTSVPVEIPIPAPIKVPEPPKIPVKEG